MFNRAQIFVMAALLAAGLGAQARADENTAQNSPAVARVNGDAITQAEIEEARYLLPPELQAAPLADIMPIVRESMIDTRLAAAQARLQGLDQEAEYKLRMQRLSDQVLERMLLTLEIRASLSEDEIQQRYEKITAFYKDSDEVRARHILLATEQQAADIIAQLDAGGDFIELAKANSIGPSAPGGGDLGWFLKGRTLPAFEEAVFALKPGTYTAQPVETAAGWHVIRLEDRRKAIIPSFAEAREDLIRERSSEIVQTVKSNLREKAQIERFALESPVASPSKTP